MHYGKRVVLFLLDMKEADRSKQKKVSAGSGSKERRGRRKRSRSRSSSESRSTSSSASSSSKSSSRSHSRSLHRRHRRSHSRSASRGGRSREHRSSDGHGNSRGSYEARSRDYDGSRGHVKKKEPSSGDARTSDFDAAAAAAASKPDSQTSSTQPMSSVSVARTAESAALPDVKPASSTFVPVADSQVGMPQVGRPEAVVAGSAAESVQQMLKTPPVVPASQTLVSSSAAYAASKFSRDSIVRSLNEMVSVPDGSRSAEDVELVEKQRSAFEFAISMYMAATEFYDGGSLWCRQCDCIFTDVSALCRHIHSDKHQLVSSALLLMCVLRVSCVIVILQIRCICV